jgi:hypothetical protein
MGQTLTSATLNQVARDNNTALGRPPIISSYLTADQSIPNVTWTTVTWGASLFSNNFGLSSSQFTPAVNVQLWVSATLFWASNATGFRGIRIWDNSNAQEYGGDVRNAVSATYTEQSWSGLVKTTTTSLLIVQAYQSSGGALTLTSGATGRTQAQMLGVYWN